MAMHIFLSLILFSLKAIFIPVQFSDTEFKYGTGDLRAVADQSSAYFQEQLHGEGAVEFTMTEPFTLQHPFAYYGRNSQTVHDAKINEAVIEACHAADKDVDFSECDFIVLLAAGPSEADGAGEDCIWPQQSFLHEYGKTISLDGRTLDKFVVITEIRIDDNGQARFCGIGDLCHETGHILGLADMYDTDDEGSGGICRGLWGRTALMDKGNLNDRGWTPPALNAIDHFQLGTGQCDSLHTGHYELEPVSDSGKYLAYRSKAGEEIFLFECRKESGRDAFIGGSGLLIYHLDMRKPDYSALWEANKVNCNPEHPCAALLEAEPGTDDIGHIFWPAYNADYFSTESGSPFTFRDGTLPELALTDIRLNENGNITFNVIKPLNLYSISCFQDAAIVSWEVSGIEEKSSEIFLYSGNKEILSMGTGGEHCVTLEDLQPQTYYSVRIKVTDTKDRKFSIRKEFRTKTYLPEVRPYIYLTGTRRNDDGTFESGAKLPLRVFNAVGSLKTEWYFNSKPIQASAEGYWTVSESGTLKAVIHHQDGSRETIIKEISVR